tara:strand:- start:3907 stop:4212 length:306 start_codon:yes stop_codon:yes gene_type:complete
MILYNISLISIIIGIITYILLYLNKIQNINNLKTNKENLKCLSHYNISLKIPFIISLICWIILKHYNLKINIYKEVSHIIENSNIYDNNLENLDMYTDLNL